MSLDGHDKLCGYQKAMFPLCIYGGQDTYSSRINFLRIWTSNNNPKIIGRFYLDYLYESRGRIIVITFFIETYFITCSPQKVTKLITGGLNLNFKLQHRIDTDKDSSFKLVIVTTKGKRRMVRLSF